MKNGNSSAITAHTQAASAKEEKMVHVDVTENKNQQGLYLRGLNGIRALAAFIVIGIHLIRQYGNTSYDRLGGFGVTMFFTLSGFLITYLLLKEIKKTNTISIKDFYIRRILRIWPLYFFYMAIGLLTDPLMENVHDGRFIFYLLFIPNISLATGNTIIMIGHYWSLGVEEQFYAFWPHLIKAFRNKLPYFLTGFIGLLLFIRVLVDETLGSNSTLYYALFYTRFDCMAIGALGAYLYCNHSIITKTFNHILFQLLAWGALAFMLLRLFHVFYLIDNELVAVVTLIIIVNQISNAKTIISLENKVMNFLGKISYGLYVYHPFVLNMLVLLYAHYSISLKGWGYVTFPFETIMGSVILAYLSYTLFESKFINLKQKFAAVKTTNNSLAVG